MQCVNVKVIFKKRQFQRILVLRSYFLSSKPNVSLKRFKKFFLQKISRNNTDQECFWIPNYNKLVKIVKKDPGTVTIHFEKK